MNQQTLAILIEYGALALVIVVGLIWVRRYLSQL
jgi:hypothetical protein